MEDEAQKMVALKKAYADIILNTAKEAAARILTAEKKSLRLQTDLCSSRDEALRMLLRLKNMLDSKTAEAELDSLRQQRRISELETRLKEAESAITDLRAELKDKGDELENAKRSQAQTLSHVPPNSVECEISELKDIPMNPSVSNDQCSSCAEKQTERSSVSGEDGFDPHKSDLASIIMRSEKPESYRNGCTQRIRAFEGNVMNGEFPSESEFISEALEKEIHNDSVVETDQKLPKVCAVRKRKTRFGNGKTARKCGWEKISKSTEAKPGRNSGGSEESLHLDNVTIDEFKIFNKGKRKRNVKSQSPRQPSRALSRCRTFSYFLNSEDNQSKSSEVETKALVRKDSDPISVSTPVSTDVKMSNKSEEDEEKKNTVIDDAPAPSCGREESNNGKARENNPKLKYTFQRKRKREVMNGPDEIASPEKKSDGPDEIELQKSGSVEESSRDSRRLAQVARQLISLSGKRWQSAK